MCTRPRTFDNNSSMFDAITPCGCSECAADRKERATRNSEVANADIPKQTALQRTVAFFNSLGYRDLVVVQEEHYQSLKMGHSNYSDDNINEMGEGYPGFYVEFKFSLTSGNFITSGVWE